MLMIKIKKSRKNFRDFTHILNYRHNISFPKNLQAKIKVKIKTQPSQGGLYDVCYVALLKHFQFLTLQRYISFSEKIIFTGK